MSVPELDESFPHTWMARILDGRPVILPPRHYTFPALVEEVERGALEVQVRPQGQNGAFLATFALGFDNPAVPTGVWSCPHPDWLCAVAGGYAYLVNTQEPGEWSQVEYRPVAEVRPIAHAGLLVFAGFHSLEAWGAAGRVWRSARLSWEGVRLGEAQGDSLAGWGWDMRTDQEIEFALDLRTGRHTGGPSF